jgi:predicted Zn-dependent peptidase
MNMLLGEGMSSRLYQTIRERYGLGYTVYSALDLYSDCGALFLYTACDNKKVEKARDMLLIECEKIINHYPVKSKELERAKAQVKAAVLMSLESMSARMQSLGRGELEEGGHEPYQETIHKINAITLEDIAKMASLYLQEDGWSSVLMLSDQKRT